MIDENIELLSNGLIKLRSIIKQIKKESIVMSTSIERLQELVVSLEESRVNLSNDLTALSNDILALREQLANAATVEQIDLYLAPIVTKIQELANKQ